MANAPTAAIEGSTIFLKGDWLLNYSPPEIEVKGRIIIDLSELGRWDSTLPAFLWQLKNQGIIFELRKAPQNLIKLLSLAQSDNVPPPPKQKTLHHYSARYKAALWFEHAKNATLDAVSFLGEIFIHIGQFITTKNREHFRPNDWLLEIREAGVSALPIVTFISFLVGMILAFVSAIQLKLFGASIYVADLVGISMTREMGALMTAIIMAGRTGAAYAAQIGTMKRSEELDALRTMGISPIDMVVLPKLVALTIMTPILAVFSAFVGMFSGLMVGNSVLGISVFQYVNEMANTVPLNDVFIGVIKAFVYGFLVAFAGAWRGLRCGNTSDAVGRAATSAVVLSLTLIVFANAIFAIILNAMKL